MSSLRQAIVPYKYTNSNYMLSEINNRILPAISNNKLSYIPTILLRRLDRVPKVDLNNKQPH